jgi:hypothetical protein
MGMSARGSIGRYKNKRNKMKKYTYIKTAYDAVGMAEGFVECPNEEAQIEAWQYLVDTGMAWSLQGWFGRTAQALIEEGVITA